MNVPRSVCCELRRLLRPLPLGIALMASTPGAGLAADLCHWTNHAQPYNRVASHADCNAPGAACTVGWQLRGRRITATFVYHVESDRPTWLVDCDAIPQPGSCSHFHWSDTADHPPPGRTHDGYLLQLDAADTFCRSQS